MIPNPFDTYTGEMPREGERSRPVPSTSFAAWRYYAESRQFPFDEKTCSPLEWAMIYRMGLQAGITWEMHRSLTGINLSEIEHAYCYVIGQIQNEISNWLDRNSGYGFIGLIRISFPIVLRLISTETANSLEVVQSIFPDAPEDWHLDNSRLDIPPCIWDAWWTTTTAAGGNVHAQDLSAFTQHSQGISNTQGNATHQNNPGNTRTWLYITIGVIILWAISSRQ